MADDKRTKANLKALKEEQKIIKELKKERKEILIAINKAKNMDIKGVKAKEKLLKMEKKAKEELQKNEDKINATKKETITYENDIKDLTKDITKSLKSGINIADSMAKIGAKQLVTTDDIKDAHGVITDLAGTEIDNQTDIASILVDQAEKTNILQQNQAAIGTAAFQQLDYDSLINDLADERLKLMTGQTDLSDKAVTDALETLDVAEKNLEVQKSISEYQGMQHDAVTDLQAPMNDLKDQAMGMAAQLQAVFANPALALVAGLGLAAKQMYDLFKGAQGLKTELGISDEAAVSLQMQISEVSMSMKAAGVESADVAEAQMALINNFGGVGAASTELLMNMAKLKADFGVSGQAAGNLMVVMQATGAASKDAAFEMAKGVASLAQAEGVAPGQVMQDIANNTEAFAGFAKDGGMNVAQAAISAKKLGINFDTSVKIADNLLDFESSIQSQMEAEILLGRQLNLDKARQLALSGDIEGLQKEVLKNVGTEAEFNAMNVLQRRALAQSIGISVTELSKMVANQANINKQTKGQKDTAVVMAMIMKAIRGLSEDLIKIWMVIKPILMVALAPIGLAVYGLIKLVGLMADFINWTNSYLPIGTAVLGILTAWYSVTLLRNAIEAKNRVGLALTWAWNKALVAWGMKDLIITQARAAATWFQNSAVGALIMSNATLNAVMSANPVGAIILGVMALIALTVFLWKKFKEGGKWATGIKIALAIAFLPITLAIGAIMLLYKGFQMVLEKVGGFKNLMTGALLVIMGPIGWLIGAGLLIWKNFDKIKETIMGIGKTIIDFVMSPIRKLKAFFSGLLPGWAVKLLGGGGDASKSAATNTGPEAQDFISRPGSGMEKFSEDDTVIGVKDEDSLGGGSGGTSIDIAPITEGLGGVINSIKALEASNKDLMVSLTGKVKNLAEA